jgi:hypothetical protein
VKIDPASVAIVADMASDGAPRGRSRSTSGRTTTPKSKRPVPTGRYTPPIPREARVSPTWVPILMASLLALGGLIILLNYTELVPGGHANNAYLLGGLVLITGGFITATQWH